MGQVELAGRMRVGVDAHDASEIKGPLVPAPVKVEAPGIRIDFHSDAIRGACLENAFDINFVTRPPQQLAPGHMAEDSGVRICHRAEDAVRLAFGIKLEAAMHAGHDEVEPLQHVIWIVQRALGQNIRFDAFENPKVVPIGSVQSVDVLMLLNDFLDR